jgi:hypothetical protein
LEKKYYRSIFQVKNQLISLYLTVAIQALKRKKRYELQLNQIDGTLTTLEYQREALEDANTNTEVFKIMGEANTAIKAIHSGINIDKVQDLKDDIAEQQEIHNEFVNIWSRPILDTMQDDDELLKELEELEQENLDRGLIDLPPAAREKFPQAPTDEPRTNGELFLDNFLNVKI